MIKSRVDGRGTKERRRIYFLGCSLGNFCKLDNLARELVQKFLKFSKKYFLNKGSFNEGLPQLLMGRFVVLFDWFLIICLCVSRYDDGY